MKLTVRVLLNLKWIQIMIQLIQLTIPLMSTPMTLYKVVILHEEVQNIFDTLLLITPLPCVPRRMG